MRRLLALLLTLVFTAAAGELAELHRQLAGPATIEAAGEGPAHSDISDIVRIGLERAPCFSGCPAFTLIIERDGRFRYSGEAKVERLGDWTGTIERGALNQVLRYVAAIDFFAFSDSYLDSSLDNASSYTLVERGDDVKVVENYANSAPATVWALEKLIEDLLRVATWDE